jgi:NADH-quinone oxidoreductase subunit J
MDTLHIGMIAVLALVGAAAAFGGLRILGVGGKRAALVVFALIPLGVGATAAGVYGAVIAVERLSITLGGLIFGALATLTIASALGVAASKNILYSGFFLLGTLVGVAGLYLYVGADFVGIAQLVIYVGGILVLVLFAVLLTNRIGAVAVTNRSVHRGIGAAAAVGVFTLVLWVVRATAWPVADAVMAPTTARIGDALLREYLLPFELISVFLLMALVGAMVVARRAAKDEAPPDEAPGLDRLE